MENIKLFFASLWLSIVNGAGELLDSLKGLLTWDFVKGILEPELELARFFYWGLISYVFMNIWLSDFWTLVFMAVTVFIVQVILRSIKGRPLSVRDYLYFFFPALLTSLQIWL